MNRRKKLAAITAIVVVAGWLAAGVAVANNGSGGAAHQKVTLCHATASDTNPYVSITVNINSVEDAENVGGHGNHEGDIIPPYTYNDFTFEGQGDQSLLPDCGVVATTTTTEASTTTSSTSTSTTSTAVTTTTEAPTTTTTVAPPVHVCQEDEACWDCKTMGNHVCGVPPVTIHAPAPALPHTL
jgi:hypothetical protein